eukprot:scaffold64301_cov53-Phaeocystis_antarctica.AAC.1
MHSNPSIALTPATAYSFRLREAAAAMPGGGGAGDDGGDPPHGRRRRLYVGPSPLERQLGRALLGVAVV